MDMTMHRFRTLLVPACLTLAVLPVRAQALPDGPEFGGGKVFSQGISSLGNSARFDQAAQGWYLGWTAGDLKPKDQQKALDGLFLVPSLDASGQLAALASLADKPWAQRTTSYSMTFIKAGGIHASLGREESTGMLATVDLDPAHRGNTAALALNSTSLDIRHAVVNRVVTGAGSMANGVAYGVAVRLEDWRWGREVQALWPSTGQVPLGAPGEVLNFKATPEKHFAATLDGGVVLEAAQGLRVGVMVDRAIPATFGDVKERAQFRAGLQIDLGSPTAQLGIEADLNRAVRMPIPAEQKSASVSLRILAGPAAELLVGAERRTVANVASNAFGATFFVKLGGFHVGAGLRFSQDRPPLALGAKFD
jgi:hypothetical protein